MVDRFKNGVETMWKRNLGIAASLMLFGSTAQAQIVIFNAKSSFLGATNSRNTSGPIPNLGGNVIYTLNGLTGTEGTAISNTMTLRAAGIWLGTLTDPSLADWTPIHPGHDMALNGAENVDIDLTTPVKAFGFDFVEPTDATCFATCFDSTFRVILKLNGVSVGSFQYNAPNNSLAFVGVWSDKDFNRVEIRELTPTTDNEYFGEFYSSTIKPPIFDKYPIVP